MKSMPTCEQTMTKSSPYLYAWQAGMAASKPTSASSLPFQANNNNDNGGDNSVAMPMLEQRTYSVSDPNQSKQPRVEAEDDGQARHEETNKSRHGVPSKPLGLGVRVPPSVSQMAYVNGNSVRPVRRRHYSQQQTGLHLDFGTANMRTLPEPGSKVIGAAEGLACDQDLADGFASSGGVPTHEAGNQTDSGPIKCVADRKDKTSRSNVFGYFRPVNEGGGGNQSTCTSDKSTSFSCSSSASQSSNEEANTQQDTSSNSSDSINNFEYDFQLGSSPSQVIRHVAKRIESVLRSAKEDVLQCSELLIPAFMIDKIAAHVVRLAENETCGVRGCFLYVSLETDEIASPAPAASGLKPSRIAASRAVARLLGKLAIDPSVVPTFEVFLTLKRDKPTLYQTLEKRIRGRDKKIFLAEFYLLNSHKLYQAPYRGAF